MTLKFYQNHLNFLINSGVNNFIQDVKYNKFDNKSQSISVNLDEINSLDTLRDFINSTNICLLKKQAKKMVFSDGNPNSSIMFIGEAPGADEDRIGKPFVGKAGQLLDKMLKSINLNRKEVYISNVIPWRPPNNRQPTTEEIMQCLPFIQKHIEIIQPKILILLGSTASKALLTTTQPMSKLIGTWHNYTSININYSILTRSIYHPAFLLRKPENKKICWEDMKEIKKVILKN